MTQNRRWVSCPLFPWLSFQRCQIWQLHANWPSDWQHSTSTAFPNPLDFCHKVLFWVQSSDRQALDKCSTEVKGSHRTSANEGRELVREAAAYRQIWEALCISQMSLQNSILVPAAMTLIYCCLSVRPFLVASSLLLEFSSTLPQSQTHFQRCNRDTFL